MAGDAHRIDHPRVSAAIRAAEARTAGEIYCVLARRSDSYFFAAAFVVACAMFAVSLVAAVVLDRGWAAPGLTALAAAQLLAWGAALGVLVMLPDARIHLVPRRLRYRRAHENAVKQFLARNVHITQERTGVLVFVSLAERYAEVVADSGIAAKVPQDAWNQIVARLTAAAAEKRLSDGFVVAVDEVGDLLARHFPRTGDDRNELDDHLVEI